MKKKDKDALIAITNRKLTASMILEKRILRKNESSRSFSKTFFDFLEPLLANDILNEKKTRASINWGQMVWNKAVAESHPDFSMSKNFEEFYPLFYGLNKKTLINEYLLRKHGIFEDDDFFVYSYELHWDDSGNMAISVAVVKVEENL